MIMNHITAFSRITHFGRNIWRPLLLISIFVFAAVNSPATAQVMETFVTVVDDQGPDQLDQATDPGNSQQDITGARIGDMGSFGWAWDETDLSGNNSIDTCTYFEETDGTVVSVCYSVQFDPDGTVTAGFPQFEVYDCDTTYDGAQQKCTGNNPVSIDYAVSCADPVQVPSYFTPDDQPDLQADCTLTLANGDPADDLLLLNTCTKTSASPSSNSNDCLFSDAVGFLQLEKVVVDGDATGADFILTAGTLTGTGPIVALSPVTADTPQALSESSPLIDDGTYQLDSIICTDQDTGAILDTTSGSVTVAVGQRVTCVFTNSIAFVPAPAYTITKSVTGVGGDGPTGQADQDGDIISYQIEVANTGNQGLTNVTVSDPLLMTLFGPSGDTDNDGVLDANETVDGFDSDNDGQLDTGETWIYTGSYTVTQADLNSNGTIEDGVAGFINNTASVTSTEIPTPQSASAAVPVVQAPALTLDKTASPATYDTVGQVINYSYLVTNSGNISLAGPVTVADDKATVTCPAVSTVGNLDSNLDPAESVTCSASYTITQTDIDNGSVTNTATASADGTDSNQDQETVTANQNPALDIVKTVTSIDGVPGGTADSAGDVIEYQVVVTNIGNVQLEPTVTDVLTQSGVDMALPIGEPTESFGDDDVMEPTETWTYSFTYEVTQADLDDGGELVNEACASNVTPTVAEICSSVVTPLVANPALSIDKALTGNADEDQSGTVSLGDTLEYTLTATNDGNVTLTNVTVSDDLTNDSTTCASVAPGGTCVLVVNYVVNQVDVDAGQILNTGTADSDQTDPVDDPETVPVPQNPALSIDKALTGNADEDQSGTVSLGDTLEYTLTATNDGNVTLTNVTVSDDLTNDSTTCASVAPGGTCVLIVTYVVTQADVDAGEILNTGTADSDQTDPVDDPETVPVPQNPALSIDKALTGNADEDQSGTVSLGDTLEYTLTATNVGNVTLTNVTVSDDLTGDSTTCASVAPGGTCVLVVTYVVAQADVDAGQILNTGTADSDQTDPVDDPETVPVPQNPAIQIVKSSSLDLGVDGIATPGDVINYSFTVTNIGDVTLSNVTVNDATAGVTDCLIGTMVPGAVDSNTCSDSYALTQTDIDNGSVFNQAFVAGEAPQGNPTDPADDITDDDTNTQDIPAAPDIDLVKTASALDLTVAGPTDRADAGDQITYGFAIENTGNVTLASVDLFDALVGYDPAVTCGVDTLAPGATTTCAAVYTLTQADVDAGSVSNTATATGTDPSGTVVDDTDGTTTDIPAAPAIDLVKTASAIDLTVAGPTDRADAGDQITYNFTIENTGNVTLDTVELDDALVSFSGASCNDPDGFLAPDESTTCSAVYTLTQADVDAGSVSNTAFAYGNPPAGDPADRGDDATDTDGTTTTIPAAPAIDLVKTASAIDLTVAGPTDRADAGDQITYGFAIENTGNVTLTSVDLLDALVGYDPAVTCSVDSLAPGDSTSCSAVYTLSQADVDAGSVSNTATATGTDPSGTVVDDTDGTTTTIPAAPAINLVKTASAIDLTVAGPNDRADAGDQITYGFAIENTGNVTLASVDLFDALVGYDPAVTCGVDTLAPGATTTCAAIYTLTQADVDAGSVSNTATATGTDPSGTVVDDTDGTTTTIPAAPAIDLVKTASAIDLTVAGPTDRADAGDQITYGFAIENTGNVTLASVDLLDALVGYDPAVTCGVDSLAPGDSTSCSAIYTLSQADVDAGSVSNTATATGTDPSGTVVDDTDGTTTTIPAAPAIDLVKTASAIDLTVAGPTDRADAGDQITYGFSIENTGNVTLASVDLFDALVGYDPAVTCGVDSLAPGDSTSCSAVYTLSQADVDAGSVSNTATATGTDPSGTVVDDTDGTTTTIPAAPAIDLVKTASAIDLTVAGPNDRADAGDQITYSFSIENTGNVTLDTVELDDALVSFSGVSCNDADGFLAPDESTTCSAVYTLTQADVDAGSVSNTAFAYGNPPAGDPADRGDDATDTDGTTTNIPAAPAIDLVKTASAINLTVAGPTDRADAGDQITYGFAIENTGNVTLASVDLFDALVGYDPAVTCGVDTLAPGATTTCAAVYTLTQADVDAGSVSNTATATGTDPSGTVVDDTDGTTTDIPAAPAIDLVKTASAIDLTVAGPTDRADAGDQITYGFAIENTGNVTLASVDLFDALVGYDPAVTCGVDTLAPGATTTCAAVYTLTQADVDAGSVSNTATATGTDPSGTVVDDTDGTTTDIPAAPAIDLVKTASAIDLTVAGPTDRADAGDQITYGFAIENTGNVTLASVDLFDALVGYDPAVTCGVDTLAPGATTTCAAVYTLSQADVDAGSVSNTATATGTDPSGTVVDDTDGTTTDIPAAPAHTFVKTFDPEQVGVGEIGTFTLVYANTGNITLSDISITDAVDPFLDVQSVTTAEATCSDDDNNDQTITCSLDTLAPGESVQITVTFLAVPLAAELVPDTGQTSGANYVFYFENGYVLYGSTADGTAFLQDPDGNVTIADVEGRNQDIYFNAPFGGDGFQLHLSCSEIFLDGWGNLGPTAEDDPAWRIFAYDVLRFNSNGLFKDCRQIFAPFDVDNEASAEAIPARGILTPNPITAQATVTLINIAPIEVTRERLRRGDVEIQYFNTSFEDIEIDIIMVEWTDGSVLESASYQDGVDLLLTGDSPQSASINTIIPARSKDWLKLSFDSGEVPEGLTITIVTSTGATLVYVFGS